jgi:hypothetical protein
MTRLPNPALRLKRRRRRFIAGLAFAAMALPAAGVAAPYKDPSVPSSSASSYLPSNFKSDSASNSSSAASSSTLPSNFRSEAASNSSQSSSPASSGTLPSNFRSEATDGHAQQPAPATVTVHANDPNGFDWGDAGIGAATIVGLLALGGGMMLLVSHNRRRTPGTTAVA